MSTPIDLRAYLPKIADYLVLASQLKHNASSAEYHRANVLAMELAFVMPSDLYRSMVKAIATPTHAHNYMTVAIEIRRYVLGEAAGDLNADQLPGHAPGAGKR